MVRFCTPFESESVVGGVAVTLSSRLVVVCEARLGVQFSRVEKKEVQAEDYFCISNSLRSESRSRSGNFSPVTSAFIDD